MTVAPVAVLLAVTFTAVNGGPWPMIIAVTAALLGGGAGMVPLISVYALVPGIDPQRRGGNPLRTSEDDGALTGLAYLMMVLVAATAVPAGVVAALFGWPGVAVGVLTGALCFWGLGVRTERRLAARGPELLDMMRTGRRPAAKPGAGGRTRFEDMSRRQQIIAGICFTTGAIPLFPQGVLAGYLKVSESPTRAWFLALYLPSWLQWPTIVFMVVLGVAIYATGVIVSYRRKESPGLGRETVTSTEAV